MSKRKPLTFDEQIGDNGRLLALTMADDKIASLLKTLRKVRATLDNDDEGYSFQVDHSDMCPAFSTPRAICGCGLDDAIRMLHEAEADANNVREQLALLGRRK